MLKNIFNGRTLLDLIIYLVVPLLIWNTCRIMLGDYFAMLLSTVPGVIYTIFTFIREKQYSATGLFILATMVIGSTMDIYSKTAHQMLWNYVYLNIGLVTFWCLTMLAGKPMAMYFFIDYAFLHGVPKTRTKVLYHQMPYFRYFMLLTGFLAFRDLSDTFLRIFLIHHYDVEGFNKIKVITQVWNTMTTVMFVYGIILIIKKIQFHKNTSLQEVQQP
ncbi:MAG: hypothetical protein NTX43_13585 [Bacteroidetes bacterium]|nr:hypothetical protein [Bacteroidota bacterium]